ncbi:MAG: hypothetical protein ACJ8GN_28395 [Longimicrobiaceae bacterium]
MTAADPRPWKGDAPAHPITVYADRSGSMAGFLDPAFPTRTDYRSVIDGLKARLAPQQVYGFGTTVRRELRPDLGVMDDRAWYGDRNTETEQVLDSVAADAAHARTHLIVTDGRRSDPTRGYGQFERMRDVAQGWIRAGGSFVVAVSLAPFTPVKDDPSGCHVQRGERGQGAADEPEGAEGGGGLKCPLYVFAFAAPGDGMRVGATLAQLFDHVWMYPAPTAPGKTFVLDQDPATPGESATFEHQRLLAADSAAVAAVEGTEPATRPLRLHLRQPDTDSPAGRLVAALLASGTRAELAARGVTSDSVAIDWMRQDGHTGAVRFLNSGRTLEVFSPGGDDCRAAPPSEPCGTLYRLELYPTGAPAWLAELEARDASDVERTFGLGRLFEPFRANAAATPPLARAYLMVR